MSKYCVWSMARSGHYSFMDWVNANHQNKKVCGQSHNMLIDGKVHGPHNIILLVRDPYNWWASFVGTPPGHPTEKASAFQTNGFDEKQYPRERLQTFIDKWRSHAREAAGVTSHIENKTVALFNRWFSDEEYRWELARQIGMETIDKKFEDVASHGQGSTWDRQSYDGKAQQMRVLERYRNLVGHGYWQWEMVLGPDIADLSQRLFGMPCPEILINQ